MYCKSCGAAMEESFVACQMCGVKKGIGRAFCEKCGAVRQVGADFCEECGNRFANDDQAAPVTNVPVSQQTPAQQFQSAAGADNSQFMPEKKFCRNCGSQVMNSQVICTNCGVKVGEGKAFCPHCAAPVSNPDQIACTSCGMSLKPVFNVNDYINKFANNFTDAFKDKDVLTILLDYGASLLSFITFIFSFLPCCYYSARILWASGSTNYNIWNMSGFAGFLLLLAFLVSIAQFVPHVDDFIKNNDKIGKYFIFVTPALMLASLLFTSTGVIFGAGVGALASTEYGGVSAGFTFLGILFIIFVLAACAAAVLSFLRKEGKIKF